MGDLTDFKRGQIVRSCLAGESMTKTATLLGILTASVSTVCVGIHESRKDNTSKKQQFGQNQHRHKEIVEKSQNYCSMGDSRTEHSS
jgi:hypothetical protein